MPSNIADVKAARENGAPSLLHVMGVNPGWEERVVTAVATTVAVMLVAAVAILMGMV